ncbi:hypothetical protein LMG24238_02288 [Paraburkholderia sediminicola]|uniref:Uncharacterized protein n=2 Tax=Paraburkholderia sediminicola TaxID=458836 RepID=A0A6J5ATI9_9BURK|nr:hypothetical protein LMG24238_02288 [Paraburkholderia sediminicola]
MRILTVVLVVASICCAPIRHGLREESIDAFAPGDHSVSAGVVDDLNSCVSQTHYASGFRPIVPADFHYGFGGLLAATSDLYSGYVGYVDIIDVIDAAMTGPIMQLALEEGQK